jgi:putative PIN family toxin of toxin-antitoxin system
MKIFLDTNVLASAVATRGLCADVLRGIIEAHQLVVSDPLLIELKRILQKKFQVPKGHVVDFIEFIRQDSIFSVPGDQPEIAIRDKDDLAILSSAINGNADLFVTGDKELLDLEKLESMEIISPRTCWKRLQTLSREKSKDIS